MAGQILLSNKSTRVYNVFTGVRDDKGALMAVDFYPGTTLSFEEKYAVDMLQRYNKEIVKADESLAKDFSNKVVTLQSKVDDVVVENEKLKAEIKRLKAENKKLKK